MWQVLISVLRVDFLEKALTHTLLIYHLQKWNCMALVEFFLRIWEWPRWWPGHLPQISVIEKLHHSLSRAYKERFRLYRKSERNSSL